MGRYIFRLPDIGEGVTEAEIVAWHVQPGDRIGEDQTMVDVMTDKATVDMTSPVDGVVVAVHGAVGDMLAVGSPLVDLEVEGEGNTADDAALGDPEPVPAVDVDTPVPVQSEQVAEPAPAPALPARAVASSAPEQARAEPGLPSGAKGGAVFASPATRHRAFEQGIALQFVPGTGPGGRITPDDLDAYIAAGAGAGGAAGANAACGNARYRAREAIEDEQIIGLRRRIAEKMQEAKSRIPHIAYVEEIDVTELEALRADLNQNREGEQPKLTLLPFLMRALVQVLPDFPQINARYDDEAGVLHRHGGVHIGIATQTPGGLMVPVVSHAESRDVWKLAAEVARISAAARDGTARRNELSGSTITITSLGPLGGVASTPVINHPEVAIIGPNKIVERPVVDGSFVSVRKMMNLSSSFDHRIVDGYDAALFVQRLKRLLEHPALIFMD